MKKMGVVLICLAVLFGRADAQNVVRRAGVEDIKYKVGSFDRPSRLSAGTMVSLHGFTPINVLAFGVDNTGATNCADSLQAAIDSVYAWGGGELYLPSGTYLLESYHGESSAPFGVYQTLLMPRSGVSISGDGPTTVLKVADGLNDDHGFGVLDSRDHSTMASCTDVSNVVFRDFMIRFNGTNNQQQNPASGYNFYNKGIGIYVGSNITIQNVQFVDNVGSNSIWLGSAENDTTTVENVRVDGCYFYKMARDPNIGDHSAIAAIADDATYVNNIFHNTPAAISSTNIVAALDIHGSRVSVSGNIVENVMTALYIGGVDGIACDGFVVDGNIFRNVGIGVSLWRDLSNSFRNIVISNNQITVDPVAADADVGIICSRGEFGIQDVKIIGNKIICVDQATSPAARGIALIYNLENVDIIGNTISDFPQQGIYVYPDGSDSVSVQGNIGLNISGNVVTNCGQRPTGGIHRSGITVGGVVGGENHFISILHNTVVDTFSTHKMTYGISVYGQGDNYSVFGNSVSGALTRPYAINDHAATGYSGWNDEWLASMLPIGADFDVSLYGAVADSISNDSDCIQAAIDAAELNGSGAVYFPRGKYLHSGNSVTDADVLLYGPGLPRDIAGGAPRSVYGSGSPESAVTAPVGSTYRRSDGPANARLYVKSSGAGNTGWVGIVEHGQSIDMATVVADSVRAQTFQSIGDRGLTIGNGLAIIYSSAGTPEGNLVAPVGSIFLRTDGSAGTTLYVKESGAGNTGWVAK